MFYFMPKFLKPLSPTCSSHTQMGRPRPSKGQGCAWDHTDLAIFMRSPEPGRSTPPGLPPGPSFLITLVLLLDRSHGAGAEGGETGASGSSEGATDRGGRLCI